MADRAVAAEPILVVRKTRPVNAAGKRKPSPSGSTSDLAERGGEQAAARSAMEGERLPSPQEKATGSIGHADPDVKATRFRIRVPADADVRTRKPAVTRTKGIRKVLSVIGLIIKARRGRYKLVPKRVSVTRGGRTYQTTVWVNPEQKPEKQDLQFDLFDQPPAEPKPVKPAVPVPKTPAVEQPPRQTRPEARPAVPREKKLFYSDVGEKIGGAKKDTWAERVRTENLAEIEKDAAMAYQHVTKHTIFGKVEPDTYRELGYTSQATQLIKGLYDVLPVRPPDSPEAREAFVTYLEGLHTAIQNGRSVMDVVDSVSEYLGRLRSGSPIHERTETKRGRRRYLRQNRHGLEELTGLVGTRADKALQQILVTYIKAGREGAEETFPRIALMNRMYGHRTTTEPLNLAEQEKANRDDWSWTESKKKGSKKERWTREVDERVRRVGGREIDVTDPEQYLKRFGVRGLEYGNYVAGDRESGRYHTVRCAEALSDLADVLGIEDRQIAFNGRLALAFGARGSGTASAHYEPYKKVINLTKFRGGGSFAHEWFHFIDNVGYETSTGGTDREKIKSRSAYLSHATGTYAVDREIRTAIGGVLKAMESRQASVTWQAPGGQVRGEHGGWISRYFEHRPTLEQWLGKYWAAEPGKGIASLARDLRNSTVQGQRIGDSSEYPQILGAFFEEAVSRGFCKKDQIPETLTYREESEFMRTAKEMGGYWHRSHEMMARCFEAYVEDKLEEQGRKSSYLVSGTRAEYKGMVYPQGETRKQVNEAMDGLMALIKSKSLLEKALAWIEPRLVVHRAAAGW